MKNSRGISLIALIITIIVIVILAAVVVTTSINTPKSANFAVFCSNIGEAQQAVALTYADRYTTIAAANSGVVSEANRKAIYAGIAGTDAITNPLTGVTLGNGGALKAEDVGVTMTFYQVSDDSALVSASGSLQDMTGKAFGASTASACEVYITSKGEVFMYPGYENTDGHNYITPKLYY